MVFLPVLSAFVGAIIGAVATGLVRAWQDRKARNHERKGLRMLIIAEVYLNDFVLRFSERPTDFLRASTDIWDQNNVRFTQLLTSEEIWHATYYYVGLKMLQINGAPEDRELTEAGRKNVKNARVSGDAVRREVQNYIKDPNFLKPLDQQEQPLS